MLRQVNKQVNRSATSACSYSQTWSISRLLMLLLCGFLLLMLLPLLRHALLLFLLLVLCVGRSNGSE